MKKIIALVTVLCVVLSMGTATLAATVTDLSTKTEIDISAKRVESWADDTYTVAAKDGVFTVDVGGRTIKVSVTNGSLPAGARLMVIDASKNASAYSWMCSKVSGVQENPPAYDIFFYQNGKRVDFNGTARVTMSAESGDGSPTVYRVGTDGTASALNTEQTADGNAFNASMNGYYLLTNALPEQPTTAAPTTVAPPTAGEQTTAAGEQTTAAGEQTTAAGEQTTADGEQTTAAGEQTTAAGEQTTAVAEQTTADETHPTTNEAGETVTEPIDDSPATGGSSMAIVMIIAMLCILGAGMVIVNRRRSE